ncbi:MAG: hypothetical protein RJA52_141 [Bacteroidota bacterium]|jgi:choline dehydrogenase
MKRFDFIIVGAGSAGCVLANRLSENPDLTVLLIEAGSKDTSPEIKVPAAFSKLFKSKNDWAYYTEPQTYMNNRQMFQPRGKVWGGCSSINAMIYIRGHQADFDEWAALGNAGWSYRDVLPYFKKSEKNIALSNSFHRQDGLLNVENHRSIHPLTDAFISAAQEAGFKKSQDFNGADQEGFGYFQVNQNKGTRWSAADAFLKPILHRKNLTVLSNTEVKKIIFKGKQATGILTTQNIEFFAEKEIILSAGAFHSPKLLMQSGVGSGSELQKAGIPLVHELKGIGKNLQDHLLGGIVTLCKSGLTLDDAERFPYIFTNLFNFLIFKKGPFTSNVAEAGGFVKTSPELDAPDLQFHFGPAFFIAHGFGNPKKGRAFSFGPTLIKPFSRGTLTLNPQNPNGAPIIDPSYFSDERDVKTMIKGYKLTELILSQWAFQPFRGAPFLPDKKLNSEDEIADFLRTNCETLYHPVGTCKMGVDEQSVVDPYLKVHGLQRLRVVDASVMPTIVRGNTHATTVMIAEKAGEFILKN